jgi:hypothetical protein
MTTPTASNRAEAIRAGLIAHVASTARPRLRLVWAASLVTVGALAGAGVSAAAFAAADSPVGPAGQITSTNAGIVIEQPTGQPTPAVTDRVIAPAGVIPGLPVITVNGDPTSFTVLAPMEIPLTGRPEGATHVRVTVTCLTGGSISWGTDPGGNNPSSSCTVGEGASGAVSAWMDLPVNAETPTLYVAPDSAAEASVVLQFLTYTPTLLGVNERGETYGEGASDQGQPDLIFAEGTGPQGEDVQGYVRAVDLTYGPGPDHEPSSPSEAAQWTAELQTKYPNGWDVPLYQSDGTTQVGTFRAGQ